MLNRRDFAGLIASSIASQAFARAAPALAEKPQAGTVAPHAGGVRTSVMMWTLNKFGTFEQNIDRVAQAGFTQVELVGEFKRWSAADTDRILARMKTLGIRVDAMAGMTRGFADPAGGEAFVEELKSLIPIAQRLGSPQIILLSGKRLEGSPAAVTEGGPPQGPQYLASIETLRRAAEVLTAAGLQGVIEPIDRLENPTIYLDGVTEAFAMVGAIGSPAVRVLFDLYHEQRTHGNLIQKLEEHIADVGLIHVADVPGRNEPGTGEVNYPNVYAKLAQLKYAGTIAMEFYPKGDVVRTLRSAREQVMRSFDQGAAGG